MRKEITVSKLIISVSIFLIMFGNFTFFTNILGAYPLNEKNALFLLSLVIAFSCVNVILLSLVCFKYTIKPVLISILLISSVTAFFMDTYHVIIDDVMVENILKTNLEESLDLISIRLCLYLMLLGVVPSILVYRLNVIHSHPLKALVARLKITGFSIFIIILAIFLFGDFYATFIREHKPLRFYANPSYYIYSIGKYLSKTHVGKSLPLKVIAADAKIALTDKPKKLIIFVLGETARADRFSLNGYEKKTNPYLQKEEVVSFKNFQSCGTSTTVSVPCMFSIYGRTDYSKQKANATENVLDILQRVGVNVLWLDNNSNSKGVADRVPYINYRTPDKNPICDSECRDEGMLVNLQAYIDAHQNGDMFIVLHIMGNHGPAYYKRYPPQFEKFTPTCKTNQLQNCSLEEINNAYDNVILYTDYVLSRAIALLKQNSDRFATALFYASDHGESLGENNVYLHGLPYMFAPEEQTHVPVVMWFGESFASDDINVKMLKARADENYSHDNIFHTILGMMGVKTAVYNQAMDLLQHE